MSNKQTIYTIGKQYGLNKEQVDRVVKFANEVLGLISDAIDIKSDLEFLFFSKALTIALGNISETVMTLSDSNEISPEELRNLKSDGVKH